MPHLKRDLSVLLDSSSPLFTSGDTRKRRRGLDRAHDSNDSDAFNTPTLLSSERRRVNHESLALRLGPDLVRELDALIPPGSTDMPTFALRKRIQDRFNLDRRHIYDYYHSKGLRVIKEDKHTNLARARAHLTVVRKPISRSSTRTPLRPATPSSPSPPSSPPPQRLHHSQKRVACTPESPLNSSPQLATSKPIPTATVSFVNPLADFFDDDYWKMDLVIPDSSLPVDGYELDLLDLDDRLACHDTKPSNSLSSVLCLSPCQTPPSMEERYEHYGHLNHALGPPCGIQQLVGSYQTYMEEQTRLYYERLFLDVGYEQASARTDAAPSSALGDCPADSNRGMGRASCARAGPPTASSTARFSGKETVLPHPKASSSTSACAAGGSSAGRTSRLEGTSVKRSKRPLNLA